MWKPISDVYNDDRSKKASINIDLKACYYFIDFYQDNIYIDTVVYPEKSIQYVEYTAKNYIQGNLNVSKTA